MPTYTAFGLTIEAEFAIPELAAATPGTPDVVVRLGPVPKRLARVVGGGAVYQTDGEHFLLDLDHIARYLVSDGREIQIQLAPRASWTDVRVFLLGSCFGALLHQRGLFVLHASAIGTDAGGILFCGPSGIGKSTLLIALIQRGYPMLADDVAALAIEGDGVVVRPAFPRARLWLDAVIALGGDLATLTRTRPGLEKYDVPVASRKFVETPTPVRRIYLLSMHDKDTIDFTSLAAAEGCDVLLRQTYRNRFVDGLGRRQQHSERAAAVAERLQVRVIHRPSAIYRIGALIDAIEADLK